MVGMGRMGITWQCEASVQQCAQLEAVRRNNDLLARKGGEFEGEHAGAAEESDEEEDPARAAGVRLEGAG